VSSGRVDLTTEYDGEEQAPTTCEAGTLIGEIALFVETTRPATATAAVASQIIEIDRKLVMRMLNEYPQAAIRMRATLAQRLTATVFDLGKVRQALARIDQLAATTRR